MSVASGPITFGSTGNVSVTFPFVVNELEFTTGSKASVNETTNARQGQGTATSSYQWATASLTNASGYFSRNYLNNAAFVILDGPLGNEVLKGSVTGGWGTTTITFNITNASTLFQVFMTARS